MQQIFLPLRIILFVISLPKSMGSDPEKDGSKSGFSSLTFSKLIVRYWKIDETWIYLHIRRECDVYPAVIRALDEAVYAVPRQQHHTHAPRLAVSIIVQLSRRGARQIFIEIINTNIFTLFDHWLYLCWRNSPSHSRLQSRQSCSWGQSPGASPPRRRAQWRGTPGWWGCRRSCQSLCKWSWTLSRPPPRSTLQPTAPGFGHQPHTQWGNVQISSNCQMLNVEVYLGISTSIYSDATFWMKHLNIPSE